eukprot:m.58583 g.58583  ORF g.58583 m.58583 type:complete len:54 (-) comp11272_c0_seq1:610-771(-)
MSSNEGTETKEQQQQHIRLCLFLLLLIDELVDIVLRFSGKTYANNKSYNYTQQ